MSTSTLPAGWVGKPETHTAPGAFRISRTYNITTNKWWSVALIRSLSLNEDVVALVALAGLDSSDVAERAIVKRVTVQNMDESEDALVSEWATPGTTNDPTPSNAYVTAQSNGGTATLDSSTIMQMTDAQVRFPTGSGTVNVLIWFDVPQGL